MSLDLEGANTFEKEIEHAQSLEELNNIKIRYLGKKGLITNLNKGLKNLPESERIEKGRQLQELRNRFESIFLARERELKRANLEKILKNEQIDITLPGFPFEVGSLHPITQTYYKIISIFTSMGFENAFGPEVEKDFYNFEALNIPKDHPARDMQDTFYINDEMLLRTHTSPVQIRTMLEQKPPIKIIAPGKVYRCDSDVSHTPMFHQVEGLLVDRDIKLSNLKAILTLFIKRLFEENTKLRFRPSYFPFTEPSAEVDISCVVCKGKGCRVCGFSGWLEILGCGMVHPNVFKAVNIDNTVYTGFAFGLGIERITMLLYGIDDIRLFFENNINFLGQF
jgi:phenylalanyl-tRNA synthetase alpha chain